MRWSQQHKPCRHCSQGICTKPRGLCWRCYADRSIRLQTPKLVQRCLHCQRLLNMNQLARPDVKLCRTCLDALQPRGRTHAAAKFVQTYKVLETTSTGPTVHLPGTPEKIAVLMQRCALELPLFDERDQQAAIDAHNALLATLCGTKAAEKESLADDD